MSNEIAPAVKRIMDIVGNEIENAFGGEFATVEAVGMSSNERVILAMLAMFDIAILLIGITLG